MAVPKKTESSEILHGVLERIIFHNTDTGFCVIKVQTDKQKDYITVLGTALDLHIGESIQAQGHWLQDPKHGLQFKASGIKTSKPSTLVGIEKYLASGLVKGIGPFFAKQLVHAFGEKTFEVIESNPEKLDALKGIGQVRKQQLLESWNDQKIIRDIVLFLQKYHIGSAKAFRIFKTYGNQSIEKISQNPYRLAQDIYGIGFKTTDTLAKQLGIPENSSTRAMAGLQHVMHNLSTEGHCAVSVELLKETTQKLLSIPLPTIDLALEDAIAKNHLVKTQLEGEWLVALHNLYQVEDKVAHHFKQLLDNAIPPWGSIESQTIKNYFEKENITTLSNSQKLALEQIIQSKVFILTGGPGVGKTTIIKNLLKFFETQRSLHIKLCAPTGRAAQRLGEATQWPTKTIHRLLNLNFKQFKQQNAPFLHVDLLIIDEVSMLDINLMHQLLEALPKTAGLLLIGDVDQLPSVGPGRVLFDLIESQRIPFVKLTEIFRQAATSQIILNAHRINQGRMPSLLTSQKLSDFYFIQADTAEIIQEKIVQLVTVRIPRRFGFDPVRDIQVLTPMNKGLIGTYSLNVLLQRKLNSITHPTVQFFEKHFKTDDKVIQKVNNYDKEVFNGDIGYITQIDLEMKIVVINFDNRNITYYFNELDEIDLAYALSVHKSQGSEYPVVLIPVAMQHYRLLARNLLYTGVTRGKKLVILVGQKKSLAIAVNTVQSIQRRTQLKERILEAFNKKSFELN